MDLPRPIARPRARVGLALAVLATLSPGCRRDPPAPPAPASPRTLRLALRAKLGTLDPVRCSSQHDNAVVSAIYEPLFQYRYGVRPYQLEPALLARMPEVSEDQLVYTFTLRPDAVFHDDPVFPEGRGRPVVAADVVSSMKRMADHALEPSGWWIYADRIRGFDAWARRRNARPPGTPFDDGSPIEGLEVLDGLRFRVHLLRPFPQLLHVLATCYAAVVPREAAERYGVELARHPVGTGPFRLRELSPATRVVLERNPRYRDPSLPRADRLEFRVFEEDAPLWLAFRAGELDLVQTPAAYFDAAFDAQGQLRPELVSAGFAARALPKLDFIYRGFDLEDPITGGFGRGKLVRQAIALALDTDELLDGFYGRTAVAYQGPIPPGLEAHLPAPSAPGRGPRLEEARARLAEAGYPGGRGLPPVRYHTNRGGNAAEQGELLRRQLARVGVELEVSVHAFPELEARVRRGQAQMFQLSWGSDYPDAENNLALFYGPNRRPGANVFAYARPEFDRLYEQARVMSPSPERTALYARMRDLVIDDAPAIASLARTRYWVWSGRVHRPEPDETWFGWIKWVEVDPGP